MGVPNEKPHAPHRVAAFVAACASGVCCVLLIFGIGKTIIGKYPTHSPKGLVVVFSLLFVFFGFLFRDAIRIARAEPPFHVPISNMYLAFGIVTAAALLPSELMYFGRGFESPAWVASSALAVIAGLLLKRNEQPSLRA